MLGRVKKQSRFDCLLEFGRALAWTVWTYTSTVLSSKEKKKVEIVGDMRMHTTSKHISQFHNGTNSYRRTDRPDRQNERQLTKSTTHRDRLAEAAVHLRMRAACPPCVTH